MKFSKRNLLIYSLAWIPYAASYTIVFLSQGLDNFGSAVLTTLMNVVPAAILGIAAIALCNNLKWSRHKGAWFFIAHFVGALAYSILWYGLVITALTIELSIRRGSFSPVSFSSYALQWQLFSGVMIYATIASIIYALQISGDLWLEEQRRHAAETRAAETEAAFANAQLAALRAQLNPHFLFNTLHSLMALVRYEPRAAEDALEKLAEMLRYVLKDKRESQSERANLVLLGDELKFIENYLTLEKMRLGERLKSEILIEAAALDCLLPAFTLQPIVENAIKHGIAPRARRGTIRLKIEIANENLLIEISDDGTGTNSEQIVDSNGLGLRLVREQLNLHYGATSRFAVETAENAGFTVRIVLPAQKSNITNTKATTHLESSRVNS